MRKRAPSLPLKSIASPPLPPLWPFPPQFHFLSTCALWVLLSAMMFLHRSSQATKPNRAVYFSCYHFSNCSFCVHIPHSWMIHISMPFFCVCWCRTRTINHRLEFLGPSIRVGWTGCYLLLCCGSNESFPSGNRAHSSSNLCSGSALSLGEIPQIPGEQGCGEAGVLVTAPWFPFGVCSCVSDAL